MARTPGPAERLLVPTTCPEWLCDGGRTVKAESERALTTSQVPAPLLIRHAAHSTHASLNDSRGFDSPWTHQASPMARIHKHQVSQPLLHQIHAAWHDVPSLRGRRTMQELSALTPPTSAAALVPSTTCVEHQREGHVERPPHLLIRRPYDVLEGHANSSDGDPGLPIDGRPMACPKTNSLELERETQSSGPNEGPICAQCTLCAPTYAA